MAIEDENSVDVKCSSKVKDAVVDFIAGTLGGAALVYVGQPFDTVKVKMQTFPSLYTGMIDCFKKTFKNDGIVRGLYAGTVPSVVANCAENSVLFAGYGYCQKILMAVSGQKCLEDLNMVQNALAGSLAAFGSSLTLCPTELIKCKLQAMREVQSLDDKKHFHKHVGPLKLTQQIIKTHGIQGLFSGLGATLLREMPGYFFFFGGYEGTRELLREENENKDDIGLLKTMAAGAVGGMIFWIVIFPADVIKSRMQVSTDNIDFTTVTKQILKKDGFLAFYNGLLPTICRTIPATAVLFVVYEYTRKYMNSL